MADLSIARADAAASLGGIDGAAVAMNRYNNS